MLVRMKNFQSVYGVSNLISAAILFACRLKMSLICFILLDKRCNIPMSCGFVLKRECNSGNPCLPFLWFNKNQIISLVEV